MFDFAEARLQVHGSNVSEQNPDDRTSPGHPDSPDERTDNELVKIQKESIEEKDSREILYRLGSIA